MVICAGCVGVAIALIVTLGRQLFVSSHGVEDRRWPLKPVAQAWRDVAGLEHGVTAGRPYSRLMLKSITASRKTT